ncbi:MAG: UDP-N-acetylmuramoyl-L-alanyl-D-glutamate--2,6-diaminopimelate ligase, partial [Acidimicrobiia bacterium]
MHDGVTVADLADAVGGTVVGDAAVRVVDATHDSRCAAFRSLFISIRGRRRDGHHHVDEAVARGASAVCVEEHVGIDVPQLMVADTRTAMPHLAARIHGMPSRHLSLVGVTGTDGKTTVVHLTAA